MSDLEYQYFEWLLTCLEPDGVSEELAYVCGLLHSCPFERRVGNDINRAVDGSDLRKEFLAPHQESDFDPDETEDLLMLECTWFEMLVALSRHLDFLYEEGVEGRFVELITNLGLHSLMRISNTRTKVLEDRDLQLVYDVTRCVDNNQFDRDGRGGIFPLTKSEHPDQREVEIWDQHAAYFRERLEGVLWTSTS